MSLISWLRNRTSTDAPRGRAQRCPAAPGIRPRLEDRLAPGGGEVLAAAARPHGYTLTDMASETALFLTSGNDPSRYPNTPFQILYYDPATVTNTFTNGGLVTAATNQFTVKPGTPFYVPLAYTDDSPPIVGGTFPTTPQAAADYVFSHDLNGLGNLQIVVDGHATALGAAYAAGPVQTPPLPDGGGSHYIAVGAFLTPLSPGVHTVTISGEYSGVAFQQATGLAFEQFAATYTVTVQPH
jgi:hypothetical protein